ncbi:hypothetical protein, partial [Mesorhizobium sp. M2E.F.Ca.ET.154.01.1.1]|uniref:hypothetical protein n=1 Tax=Mesorhizobium sp. M2E.F.Ca.ET.154.01.1.1 TaxID=2500521 RepID=UPI00167A5EF9
AKGDVCSPPLVVQPENATIPASTPMRIDFARIVEAGARAGDLPHLALFVVPHASIAKLSIFSAG